VGACQVAAAAAAEEAALLVEDLDSYLPALPELHGWVVTHYSKIWDSPWLFAVLYTIIILMYIGNLR
jgi:hypothetical protein